MFKNPRNCASLTNIIDVTAHSTSLFQENEQPNNINDMYIYIYIYIPNTDISIAEPIDVHIDELGNALIQIYHFIGIINDEHAPGLERILNYMNEHFFKQR